MIEQATYAGRRCQQHPGVFAVFCELFAAMPLRLIIELGSGSGAFAQFLADASKAKVLSYCLRAPTWPPRETLIYRQGDIMASRDEVALVMADADPAMILCDGGNKPAEFAWYAPLLRPGDVIMAHDYAATRAIFAAKLRGKVWNWCEATNAQLASAVRTNGLAPFRHDEFAEVVWGSFWKPRM